MGKAKAEHGVRVFVYGARREGNSIRFTRRFVYLREEQDRPRSTSVANDRGASLHFEIIFLQFQIILRNNNVSRKILTGFFIRTFRYSSTSKNYWMIKKKREREKRRESKVSRATRNKNRRVRAYVRVYARAQAACGYTGKQAMQQVS